MLIRKLAVPLVNEKILQQAEHCYIVTSAISEAGFEFLRSRIPPKCRMDVVTGLDGLTSPSVLKKVLSHYQGRIDLRIFTRNPLHANVYIFDLPFRKTVAFTGSGSLSLEGLKDHEEIFWKVTDGREVEAILSWFTGYFEFSVPLTSEIVMNYERIYPGLKIREFTARKEKREALAEAVLNLDSVKFRHQYFKRENYEALSGLSSDRTDADAHTLREQTRSAVQALADAIKSDSRALGLYQLDQMAGGLSLVDSSKVRSVFAAFGKNASGFNPGLTTFQFGVTATHFSVRLVINIDDEHLNERLEIRDRLSDPNYKKHLFQSMAALGSGYFLEVGGTRRPLDFYKQETQLAEAISGDPEMILPFFVERVFNPGDNAIITDQIAKTLLSEFSVLLKLAEQLLARQAYGK